jgi:hypothetical protein
MKNLLTMSMKKLLMTMAVGVAALAGGVLAAPGAAHADATGAYIQNRYTGLCISTDYASKHLYMATCNTSSPIQRWNVVELPSGFWYIQNANTGYCLFGNGRGGMYMDTCTTNIGEYYATWGVEDAPYYLTHYLQDKTTLPNYDCLYNVGSTLSSNLSCTNRNTDQMWYIS